MYKTFILFSVLLVRLPQSDCARILAVYSFPILSYQEINRVLTEKLLQYGHELVVLTTDPAYTNVVAPPNLTEIDVHDISYHVWEELEDSIKAGIKNPRDVKLQHDITETINKIFLLQINSEGFQKLIHDDNKFDLILLEAGISSNMILSDIFKAPVIIVSSYGSNYMDVPSVEKVYQSISRQNNLAFWNKMYEIYKAFSFEQFIGELEAEQDEHIESVIGYNRRALRELRNNVDVLFLNEYPMWEGVKPMTPSTVSLGRLKAKPRRAHRPQDLQKFFNSSTSGVIYVNVGANIKSSLLPPEKINTIVKVMSELPYDVLFKWDEDELPGRSPNIKIIKQLPQLNVLNHPKLRLFINDGDLKSSDDAISAGVPVVGIPFMSNQFFNAENYERFKIGLKLDLLTLTEENLKNAVNTVITDQSFRDNTVHLRSLMFDQRQRPLTRALWWIEYVLKFKGANHLRSPVTNMHWTEYYQLELIFFVIFLYVMAMLTLMIFCYFLFLMAGSGYRLYLRRNMKSKTYFP